MGTDNVIFMDIMDEMGWDFFHHRWQREDLEDMPGDVF